MTPRPSSWPSSSGCATSTASPSARKTAGPASAEARPHPAGRGPEHPRPAAWSRSGGHRGAAPHLRGVRSRLRAGRGGLGTPDQDDRARHHSRAPRTRVSELEEQVTSARGEHPALRAAVASLTARRELMRSVGGDAAALSGRVGVTRRGHHRPGSRRPGGRVRHSRRGAQGRPLPRRECRARALPARPPHRPGGRPAGARRARLDLDLLTTPDPDVPAAEARAGEAAESLERSRAARQVADRAPRARASPRRRARLRVGGVVAGAPGARPGELRVRLRRGQGTRQRLADAALGVRAGPSGSPRSSPPPTRGSPG